ncbi:MAG: hypothetical protein Q8P81_01475 [Nanoarchaeota archaeon]|nr:hypothetical protein [Nanoarchaeota archaeon]
MDRKKEVMVGVAVVVILALIIFVAAKTIVPGHADRYDKDGNGYPDEGKSVNGKYTSLYAYDDLGKWYWDLGDGRIQGNVESVEDLDSETLTQCDYQVQYRGKFENDPFLDSGWIMNNINCNGYDDDNTYNYLIVHESDPRYKGVQENAIWGNWEYKVLTVSGQGNLARPEKHVD